MASLTALPHDPRELEREDRGGCQDDDDVHHFRALVLFVAFDLSPKNRQHSGCAAPDMAAKTQPSAMRLL